MRARASGAIPVGVAGEQGVVVGEQLGDEVRQAVGPGVGDAHREHRGGVRDEVELELCVAAEHCLPRLGERRPAHLAEGRTAVGQEDEPPDGIDGDRREDVGGASTPSAPPAGPARAPIRCRRT